MDNKTRIEKEAEPISLEAEIIFNNLSYTAIGAISPSKSFCLEAMEEYGKKRYIAGATAEQERFEKWKEELKRVIKWECADTVPDLKSMNKLLKLIDSITSK